MVKTLALAISKAAGLPEAAQEQLGRELLGRIDTLSKLRAEIEIGLRQLTKAKARSWTWTIFSDKLAKVMASTRRIAWAPAAKQDLLRLWRHYSKVASPEIADKLLSEN